ncbi:MAG: ATP-binding protein [Myxococcales bacterium]|nr:ATP-binding protein [Myxococcales bacterium]
MPATHSMTWQKRIDTLLHPALLTPGIAWRSRFLVECLAVGVFVSFTFAVIYWRSGLGAAAAFTFAGSAGLTGCLFALRWARAFEPVVWSAMLVCLAIFSMPAITEPTLDAAILAWVAVVPFVGALLLPTRHAVLSAFVSLAAVVLMVALRSGPSTEAPDTVLSTARVMALVATVFVFGVRFSREQARALAELDNANRAKSAFLATMSHEIRTPMNGVLGITEVLLAGPLDVDTREKLSLVRQSGHTLVALVNDILDFSKIEAGKLVTEPIDFDVRLLVDDVSGLHRSAAKLKDVGLTVTIDPTIAPVVRGDALRLRQVLNNLVANAVKFTERGEVRLNLEALLPGNRLRFTVADTGIGIPQVALGRLFAPFEQGDGSTTRRFGGTGLGLALSQNLVRLMGGEIAVESVVGVGSRFSFDLPFEMGVMALAQQPLEVQAPEQPSSLPVLVVDDNIINLKVACSLLEKAGYRTETAENGQQALDLVVQRHYLLVLMDCHMPVMDGFVATERIRALDGEVGMTPVVALTASAMPEELEACKRAGMNDCLTKPVSLAALKAVLHRVEHYRGIFEGAA